jgi:mRNA interferase RelE/StbE
MQPRTPGCRKLRGSEDTYRVRVGDYRIIYVVEDARVLVTIVRAGHRRDVYR